MTPPYAPLKTIQLLSETSFSKIKNKKVIWGGTLKWDTLYRWVFVPKEWSDFVARTHVERYLLNRNIRIRVHAYKNAQDSRQDNS